MREGKGERIGNKLNENIWKKNSNNSRWWVKFEALGKSAWQSTSLQKVRTKICNIDITEVGKCAFT